MFKSECTVMSSDEGKKSIRSLFPFLDKWFVRYRMNITVQGSKKIYRYNNNIHHKIRVK